MGLFVVVVVGVREAALILSLVIEFVLMLKGKFPRRQRRHSERMKGVERLDRFRRREVGFEVVCDGDAGWRWVVVVVVGLEVDREGWWWAESCRGGGGVRRGGERGGGGGLMRRMMEERVRRGLLLFGERA